VISLGCNGPYREDEPDREHGTLDQSGGGAEFLYTEDFFHNNGLFSWIIFGGPVVGWEQKLQ